MSTSSTWQGRRWALAWLCAMAGLACPGSDGPTTPENREPEPDRTPPTVISTTPSQSATAVGVSGTISATFSEAMDPSTINATTFTVSDGVTGSVGYADRTATFTPAAALGYGSSYTATITTGARDMAGNALAQSHSWTFSTASPPVPLATVPLADGQRWRYEGLDSNVVCAASTGCTKVKFDGEYFLHAEQQVQWEGRSAWRVMVYKIQKHPGAEASLDARMEYLSQGANGLERWFRTGSGGEWRMILSTQQLTYGRGTFLLQFGPSHGDGMVLASSSATVPAGSYATLRALHEHRESGEFATRTIFETRTEHYSNGVGLVLGQWDYTFDDRDPRAADVYSKGQVALTHFGTGPFPTFPVESEPNDAAASATIASAFTIARGDVLIGDAGAVLTDAGVGCTQTCVHPNKNGEKKIQDWYRVDVPSSMTVRIELVYDLVDVSGKANDLDLYVFQQAADNIRFVGAGTTEEGRHEVLTGTLPPGTYYFAVQAWDTPGARVNYWLLVK